MLYRTLPRGGERLSVIGLGAGSLHHSDAHDIENAAETAIDAGVNLFDFIPSTAAPFEPLARVLRRHRQHVYVQVHIGAEYTSGAYGWTTDAALARREFEARLRALGTDYADFGFIHCIDEDADFERVMQGGIWGYALRLKAQGAIRHLAFSTHSAHIARRFLATGAMDFAMFSINPMYDYTDASAYGKGAADDRMELYREFERAGVGVSVMKAFAGGQLLDAARSPFGRALTKAQCVQYALDRPGVLSVLPGVRSVEDVRELLACLDAPASDRDYSVLGELSPTASGLKRCVYCNHCQPCPVGLQIGLVNKYYDLARLGDELARDHYMNLETHASSCIDCGHCNARCPFGVQQSARMREVATYFGE